MKAVEFEHLFENNDILCLTETQRKIEKICFSRSIKYITSMRDVKDKKVGLNILYKNTNFLIKKIGYFSYSMSNLLFRTKDDFSLHVGYQL